MGNNCLSDFASCAACKQKVKSYHWAIPTVCFHFLFRFVHRPIVLFTYDCVSKKENAGHYWNANNHWNVRFNELNVHLQCEHCNTFLSGNLIEYRENIILKIGEERFNILSLEAKKTRKFSVQELKEIIETYKQKVKQFEL